MINTVLFDLDGVLVDATELHFDAFNKALKQQCGFELSRSEHESTFNGLPTKKKLNILVDQGRINQNKVQMIHDAKQALTLLSITEVLEVDQDKQELLRTLDSKGITIGVVTNSIRQTTELMLKQTGLFDLVDYIYSNEDVPYNKPNPSPYLYAMSKLGAKPRETLIIEDSDKGFESASQSGAFVYRVDGPKQVTLFSIKQILEIHNDPRHRN